MSDLKNGIKKFYKQYIYPYDPAGSALRRSWKTLAAIGIALAVFYPTPQLVLWAVLAAYLTNLAVSGPTILFRKKILFGTGLAMAVLIPPAGYLGQATGPAALFILLLAFSAFYLNVIDPAVGRSALMVLIAAAVSLGRPVGLSRGLLRAEGILGGMIIAYLVRFYVLPLRPQIALKKGFGVVMTDITDLLRAIREGYHDPAKYASEVDRLKSRALDSLEKFLSIPSIFGPAGWREGTREESILAAGLGLRKIYGNLLTVWQLRKENEAGTLLDELSGRVVKLLQSIEKKFSRFSAAEKKDETFAGMEDLDREIEDFFASLKNVRKESGGRYELRQWTPVLNTLYALRAVVRKLGRADRYHPLRPELEAAETEPLSAGGFLKKLRGNFQPASPHFRLAVQAGVTAGAALLLSRILDLQYGYWIIIFSVIALKPSLGGSLRAGKYRLTGSLIGISAGLGTAVLFKGHPHLIIPLLLVAVFFTLYLRYLPYLLTSISVNAFTLVLLLIGLLHRSYRLGLVRLYNTGLAVAVGMLAAYCIWPNRAGRRLGEKVTGVLEKEKEFFGEIMDRILLRQKDSTPPGERVRAVRDSLADARSTFDAADRELHGRPVVAKTTYTVLLAEERIFDTLLALEAVKGRRAEADLRYRVSGRLNNFGKETDCFFDRLIRRLEKRGSEGEFPDLPAAFAAIKEGLRAENTRDRTLAEILNLSTLLWNLKTLVEELEDLKKMVRELVGD